MPPFHGLVAATHTPFDAGGELNLTVVEAQAAGLVRDGVLAAFVGGTTGECSSLTVDERMKLAGRWRDVVKGSKLGLVVHVGANCLADAKALAAHAQSLGAVAISALSPSYFKPATVESLVACCEEIAAAAAGTPFYYYDIPSLTGVTLPTHEFLRRAAPRIPTLAGVKVSNPDLVAYQLSLAEAAGRYDLPWGTDECLLAALAVGAQGAVGSTYNFAASLYRRIIEAVHRNDFDAARAEQLRSVRLVHVLAKRGYCASAKALMAMRGVDVGPPRLPFTRLSPSQSDELRAELRAGDFV
jgi:N-acetylneuraminate lyase